MKDPRIFLESIFFFVKLDLYDIFELVKPKTQACLIFWALNLSEFNKETTKLRA